MTRNNNVVAEVLIESVFAAAGAKTPEQKARAGWRFNDMLWLKPDDLGPDLLFAVSSLLLDAGLPRIDSIRGEGGKPESFADRMTAAKAAKRQRILDRFGKDAARSAAHFEGEANRYRVEADRAMLVLQPSNTARYLRLAKEARAKARILRDHAATIKTAA